MFQSIIKEADMKRHYGLKIDDRVKLKGLRGVCVTGKVIVLYATDNNGSRIRLDDGRETDIVSEWCEVLPKHERCPTCGKSVDSNFDHVDPDEFCTPPEACAAA
jgi:hypothetical protein